MKATILFIVGAGHSGSTLLAKTLNAHSQIFSISEIANFYEDIHNPIALCGCGKPLQQCTFWEEINQQLVKKTEKGIKQTPHQFRIFNKPEKPSFINKVWYKIIKFFVIHLNIKTVSINQRIKNIEALFETLFKTSQAKVIVDSSKSPQRARLLAKNLRGYTIKIIHLARDGRAVVHSYQKGYYRVKTSDPETGAEKMETYYSDKVRSTEESVNRWKKDNQAALGYFKHQPNYYFLRYEDFASYPEEELKLLMEFIGLEFEPEMLNLNRYTNHMVSGNASRINAENIEKPYNSWKKQLDNKKINYFNQKAGKLNQRLGYQ